MKPLIEEKSDSFCLVLTELKSLGVKIPKKVKANIPKQTRSVSGASMSSNKVFGISISDQEKVCFEDNLLPKFIVTSTTYLKKFSEKEIGLFRKAGSVSRQKDLRIKLEQGLTIDESEPNDVACLLKQWLRELPEPLIPNYLQDLFVRCQNLQVEDHRVSAVLLCCHLLPSDHFDTLKHLLQFLYDIAQHCDKNKMCAYNLALIMAPNIFVMRNDSIDKSSSNLVQQHTSVIELLINNVHKVSAVTLCSSSHLEETEALKFGTEFDLSVDAVDCSPSKPKKKKRSGPVQDLFTGIRKLVGQNSVSPNTSKQNESSSDTRCASKRKVDPESLHLMSPHKKRAIAASVLQDDTPTFTPNSKKTRSIFGIKEKSGKSHSRRRSFGLLKKKEKRQKSTKSTELVETNFSVNTPDPFKEKLAVAVKLEPAEVQESFFVNSSPLLSSSDIEMLFSKSSSIKKSASDCCLTGQNHSLKTKELLSVTSEGCLHHPINNLAPYNLRSKNSNKAVKRKSDEVNRKSVSFDFTADSKENSELICSPGNDLKNSPLSKQQSIIEKASNILVTKTLSNVANNNLIQKSLLTSDTLKVPLISVEKCSSRKKIAESLNDINSSLKTKTKCVSDANLHRSHIKDANDGVLSTALPDVMSLTASSLHVEEKVKRKCSISRQEAFIIKPRNSKKNSLSQLKRADSIKISRSKLSCINIQNNADCKRNQKLDSNSSCKATSNREKIKDTVANDSKCKQKSEVEISKIIVSNGSKSKNVVPSNVSNCSEKSDLNSTKKSTLSITVNGNVATNDALNKRRSKRNIRNGSIIRGRPNTVKTGLRSDICTRYNGDSISLHTKHQSAAPTSSVDNDLFLNVVNHCEKNCHDISLATQFENITLSSPKESTESNKEIFGNLLETAISDATVTRTVLDTQTTITVTDTAKEDTIKDGTEVNAASFKGSKHVKDLKMAPKRKSRDRICSNSDSKIHHMKKKPSKISRINSFPEPSAKVKPRKGRKLRAVKSSSPRKSLRKETETPKVEQENLCIKESENQSNNVATPSTNALTPETWVSGRKFFDSVNTSQDDIISKRESIAMILRNNPGHVRAKASIYDCRTRTSITMSNSTPLMSNSTPGGVFYDSQLSSRQKKSASVRSNRSTRRNSPLPPPPKFVIPDSPLIPSYPLKELTNISNTEDTPFTPSPAKKTPIINDDSSKKKRSSKCTLKPKMNSYSGHTPYKLPANRSKVLRSESSPLLPKVRIARNARESPSQSSSVTKLKNSSPATDENSFSSPVFKTRSALSIDKLRSDQMLDEWKYEM